MEKTTNKTEIKISNKVRMKIITKTNEMIKGKIDLDNNQNKTQKILRIQAKIRIIIEKRKN